MSNRLCLVYKIAAADCWQPATRMETPDARVTFYNAPSAVKGGQGRDTGETMDAAAALVLLGAAACVVATVWFLAWLIL